MNLIQNHSKQKYFGKKWIQIGTEINNEPKHKLCDFTLFRFTIRKYCDKYAILIRKKIHERFVEIISGYVFFAEYTGQPGEKRSIVHQGYKFRRHRTLKNSVDHLCTGYYRYKCRAKVSTRMVGGYEMLRLCSPIHTHPPDLS